jgi:hypothetical protein
VEGSLLRFELALDRAIEARLDLGRRVAGAGLEMSRTTKFRRPHCGSVALISILPKTLVLNVVIIPMTLGLRQRVNGREE